MNGNALHYSRTLSVESGWDLVVAGGGPAGASAALSAARSGLEVLVLEASTRIGGMGTGGMVSSFAPMSDGNRCIAGGIAQEVIEKLHQRGACGPQVTPEFWTTAVQRWIPFRPEELILLWDELLEEAGVAVRFGSRVVDAVVADGSITGVVVGDVEGLHVVRAPVYVDGTGDASLAVAAGFPAWRAGVDTESIMPPTLCCLFSGVAWDRIELNSYGNYPARQQELLELALSQGRFSNNDRHFPGLYRIGDGLAMMNAGHIFDTDAVDRDSVSDAYRRGRALVREYLAFFREYVKGCERMQLVATAPLLGVRDSRRIQGEYVLDYRDFARRRMFADNIGISSGSVDIHVYNDSDEEYERYFEEFNRRDRLGRGESFGVPYRSLLPRGTRNLWVAGRCISTDVKVQGALRIQPAASVMGQAAGAAASQALKDGLDARDVDVDKLRASLSDAGAVLK